MRAYFHLPYRQTQGVVILTYQKYHAYQIIVISRRINRLNIQINERLGNDVVIALDSTGIKVDNRENGYGINGMLEKVTLDFSQGNKKLG